MAINSGFVNEFDAIIFLKVLFDVVPGIKFQDAIELISMQPIASTSAAWKRCKSLYALAFVEYQRYICLFGLQHNSIEIDMMDFNLGCLENVI